MKWATTASLLPIFRIQQQRKSVGLEAHARGKDRIYVRRRTLLPRSEAWIQPARRQSHSRRLRHALMRAELSAIACSAVARPCFKGWAVVYGAVAQVPPAISAFIAGIGGPSRTSAAISVGRLAPGTGGLSRTCGDDVHSCSYAGPVHAARPVDGAFPPPEGT